MAGPARLEQQLQLKRGTASTSSRSDLGRRMLWIAALTGGIFGLLGGWLIDRLGRKTIMIASILAYSVSPVAAAFSAELWQLVLFRCTTFIGVCVEMVAAVTWLAELFEDKRTRELVDRLDPGDGFARRHPGHRGLQPDCPTLQTGIARPAIPRWAWPDNVAWRFHPADGFDSGGGDPVLMPFVPESARLEAEETRRHVEAARFR